MPDILCGLSYVYWHCYGRPTRCHISCSYFVPWPWFQDQGKRRCTQGISWLISIARLVRFKIFFIQANGIGSECEYKEFSCRGNHSWIGAGNLSPQDLFDQVTYSLEEMLEGITVRLSHFINGTYRYSSNATHLGHIKATEQRRRWNQKCWTFTLQEPLRKEPVHYMNFYT